jgi:hypothetical protein
MVFIKSSGMFSSRSLGKPQSYNQPYTLPDLFRSGRRSGRGGRAVWIMPAGAPELRGIACLSESTADDYFALESSASALER